MSFLPNLLLVFEAKKPAVNLVNNMNKQCNLEKRAVDLIKKQACAVPHETQIMSQRQSCQLAFNHINCRHKKYE